LSACQHHSSVNENVLNRGRTDRFSINRFNSGNVAYMREEKRKRDTYNNKRRKTPEKLECGPAPKVMAALPNIGGALCSAPQSFPDAHY